jgi:3-dehydroquinate dehydratase type II
VDILVINGPNINMLGIREPEIYGTETYDDLMRQISDRARELSVSVTFVQSNCEGALVDAVQSAYGRMDGIIINPAAYTHTSIALLDALKAVGVPAVEVHLSNPDAREDFRKVSYIRPACIATIKGRGIKGYLDALETLVSRSKEV